jgi:DNA (cytosine-5)-methyltransferase 1
MTVPFRVAGLFAGIGGIELGFERALGDRLETTLLCESWRPAQEVLIARFPHAELLPDVREFRSLPSRLDVLMAGFPCTDLSQAGRTAGITGMASGLVTHMFDALRLAGHLRTLPWLMIENVPNMLSLDGGRAMVYLVREIEDLGYRWAYRVVDSRFTGVPQRRRRVILLASPTEDPRSVLFADDAGERDVQDYSDNAFGFYWTEGRTGLGWAQDAVPTLKGGSTVGIPSPPALWLRDRPAGRALVTPTIEDAEALQGFPRGWTGVDEGDKRRNGPRWRLVGNAVTVNVSAWVAERLANPGSALADEELWEGNRAWPRAAWGDNGKVWSVRVSEFPRHDMYQHLIEVVDPEAAQPLSHRAAAGFWSRLSTGNLGRYPGFRTAIVNHVSQLAVR